MVETVEVLVLPVVPVVVVEQETLSQQVTVQPFKELLEALVTTYQPAVVAVVVPQVLVVPVRLAVVLEVRE